MRTKVIAPILAFIGLGSLVVFGNSPDLVGNFLESVKGSPIAKIFSPKPQTESETTALPSGKKLQASESVPDEIVYFILFNHLVSLKEQAQVVAAEGSPSITSNCTKIRPLSLIHKANCYLKRHKPAWTKPKRLTNKQGTSS